MMLKLWRDSRKKRNHILAITTKQTQHLMGSDMQNISNYHHRPFRFQLNFYLPDLATYDGVFRPGLKNMRIPRNKAQLASHVMGPQGSLPQCISAFIALKRESSLLNAELARGTHCHWM